MGWGGEGLCEQAETKQRPEGWADSGLEKGVQAEGLGRIKPEGTEDEAGTVSC